MRAIALLMLFAVPAAAADPTDWSFRIVRREGYALAIGSGTPVPGAKKGTWVLTNAHVVPDGALSLTVVKGGKEYRATYVRGSRVRQLSPTLIDVDGPDLALLAVDEEWPTVTVADEEPAEGARIRQWGYGGAVRDPIRRAGVYSRRGDWRTAYNSIASVQGDSGSGVFNDNLQLVGVCWGVGTQVRLGAVKSFLADEPCKK